MGRGKREEKGSKYNVCNFIDLFGYKSGIEERKRKRKEERKRGGKARAILGKKRKSEKGEKKQSARVKKRNPHNRKTT